MKYFNTMARIVITATRRDRKQLCNKNFISDIRYDLATPRYLFDLLRRGIQCQVMPVARQTSP